MYASIPGYSGVCLIIWIGFTSCVLKKKINVFCYYIEISVSSLRNKCDGCTQKFHKFLHEKKL